jgi:hypothetical protein
MLLLAATAVLAFGPKQAGVLGLVALAGAATVTATGLLLAKRAGSRAPFRAAILVAAVDVALLLAGGSSLA